MTMGDLNFLNIVSEWASGEGLETAAALDAMKRSEFYAVALGHYHAGATRAIVDMWLASAHADGADKIKK